MAMEARIMERITGPTMLALLGKRPWTINDQAVLLADIHKKLHEILAPDWIRDAPCGAGTQLLHLDLHPSNIMIGYQGPVVIDWSNAARGHRDADVALTWVLLTAADIPSGRIKSMMLGSGRSLLIRRFLREFNSEELKAQLPAVIEWKLTGRHMSRTERDAMRRLAESTR